MMFFLAEGRLGNQLFQYLFLKTIRDNNQVIVVFGFDDLTSVFEINDVVSPSDKNRFVRVLLSRFFKPILTFLSNKNVISSIVVNRETVLSVYSRESTIYSSTQGFFRNFTYVKLGHFQSEEFFDDEVAKELSFKKKYLEDARFLLKSIPEGAHKIFVHVRRGDYKGFKIYGQSTLLPISYFKEKIEWFSLNKKNSFYIFLSDDPEFINKEFSFIKNKLVSTNNHYGTDLALMSLCDSAILSPSSFGWWGSYLMKDRDIVFAPKYWLGFRSKIEFHSCSTPSYAIEVDV